MIFRQHDLSKLIFTILFLFILILILPSNILAQSSKIELIEEGGSSSEYLFSDYKVTRDSGVTVEMLDEKLRELLSGKGEAFINASREQGIDAAFLASIAMHETGGNSTLLREANNVGGIKCRADSNDCYTSSNGVKWQRFDSIDESISFKAALLRNNYIDEGLVTVTQIQKKYCPDSDGDCSTTWVKGVSGMMESFGANVLGVADLTPGEKVDTGNSDMTSVFVYEDPFEDIESNIKNTGLDNRKSNYSSTTSYISNLFLSDVANLLFNLARVFCVLIIGIITLIWLLAVLGYSGMIFAYEILVKISKGKIDIYEDGMGKLFKYTGFAFLVCVIVISGLLPKIFALIYGILANILEYISRISPF